MKQRQRILIRSSLCTGRTAHCIELSTNARGPEPQLVPVVWLHGIDVHTFRVYAGRSNLSAAEIMSKRINVILPESTLAVLDRLTSRGNRSRFISQAVLHLAQTKGKHALREQLKAGYKANAEDSLSMAVEWFPLEEEAWQRSRGGRKTRR
jgi:CopG family transcriptional regulator / antitoxin EndoAI